MGSDLNQFLIIAYLFTFSPTGKCGLIIKNQFNIIPYGRIFIISARPRSAE